MVLTILRILILYVLATAAVRIMGKRQIGELQPSELVITILLSEIAAIPMQDTDIPLLNSVVAVLLLGYLHEEPRRAQTARGQCRDRHTRRQDRPEGDKTPALYR